MTDRELEYSRSIICEETGPRLNRIEQGSDALLDTMVLIARSIQNIEVKLLFPTGRIWDDSPVQWPLTGLGELDSERNRKPLSQNG